MGGSLLGCAVALGLSNLLDLANLQMPPPPGFSRGYPANMSLNSALVLEAVVIGTVTTALAAFYPAYRASRMNIVDAIRSAR